MLLNRVLAALALLAAAFAPAAGRAQATSTTGTLAGTATSSTLLAGATPSALAADPILAAPALATVLPTPVPAAPSAAARTPCEGSCEMKITPAQLLASAERLVREQHFTEASALLKALELAPGYTLQTRFLNGYIAAAQGDHAGAAHFYKQILADDPSQTRVRLELSKAMLALGQTGAADRQLRLAQQSRDLDPVLDRLVRGARSVIRSKRAFSADVRFGFAPDSNINNATTSRIVDVQLGDFSLPLTLDEGARARSGVGQTGSAFLSARVPVSSNGTFAIANGDLIATNYDGKRFDDFLGTLALGAEKQLSDAVSMSLQGLVSQRWYGGRAVSRQVGARGGAQVALGGTRQAGVQLDLRRTTTSYDRSFDGWQGGLYASYETAVTRRFFGSAQAYVRRDWLREKAFSSTEVGVAANVGGELPFGVNVGFGGSLGRAVFDAPQRFFSDEERKDWRLTSRVTLGYRKIRVFGFSPQVSWQASVIDSSLPFYKTSRNRFAFDLARFF